MQMHTGKFLIKIILLKLGQHRENPARMAKVQCKGQENSVVRI